jgi:hypothetical protein
MTFRVQGDPKKLEELAAQNPDKLPAISEKAKQHGLIAHRFYGSDDGWILVVDEWPDPQRIDAFLTLRAPGALGALRNPQVIHKRVLPIHLRSTSGRA